MEIIAWILIGMMIGVALMIPVFTRMNNGLINEYNNLTVEVNKYRTLERLKTTPSEANHG